MTGNQSPGKPFIITALTAIFYVYGISVMIAVPYYNWKCARENGFVRWLLLGEIVPTGKAFVWPYYAFYHGAGSQGEPAPLTQQQVNKMQIMTVLRALETAQQSNFISNSLKPNEELTEAQVKRMLDYDNQALLSANSTDEETLDRIYPELGTRFKGQFAESRRLFLLGMKNHSRADLLKSKELDDLWAAWYMTNRKRIEDAFNQTMP